MALDEGISRLIGRIYEGALDPQTWDAAIDEALRKTGSFFALLAVLDTKKHDFATTGYHGRLGDGFGDMVKEYEGEFFRSDPSFDFILANPHARWFDTSEHLPKEGYGQDSYTRWSIARIRSSHWTVGFTPEDDGFTFAASFHSAELLEPHADRDRRLFRLLFEHMERAQRLAARPPDLGSTDKALVLLDRRGGVLSLSPEAERIIAAEPALALRDRMLRPVAPAERRRWDVLVHSALSGLELGGAGGAMALPRVGPGRPLLITVDRLPPGMGGLPAWRAAVVVRIVDPDAASCPGARERWRTLFGLTGAEARLAEALIASECDLRRAADRCGVTYATARTQLAGIFAKTDTHGQAQLVRLLTLTGG